MKGFRGFCKHWWIVDDGVALCSDGTQHFVVTRVLVLDLSHMLCVCLQERLQQATTISPKYPIWSLKVILKYNRGCQSVLKKYMILKGLLCHCASTNFGEEPHGC